MCEPFLFDDQKKSEKINKQIAKSLVEKHVKEHLHQQRLGSVGVHSESEKVGLKQLIKKFKKIFQFVKFFLRKLF